METKDLIRQAATEEFATHGFQGARIGAIVKAAQINERMIYHYFGSKEGLYKAVLEEEWLGVASTWQPVLAEALKMEPLAGLRHAFRAFAALLAERPYLLQLSAQEAMSGWRHVPEATVDMVPKELRQLYARGKFKASFEAMYFAINGAIAWNQMFSARFKDVRKQSAKQRLSRSEEMIELILAGVEHA